MKKVVLYFQDVYNEMIYKVSWPSWSELQGSSIVVMTASLIIAMIIFLMDISFRNIMELIYSILY